jgi:hypothetical protein
MSGVAVSAQDVGNVLTYVAPGFFAYAVYRSRLEQARPEATQQLVVAIAASVPLVALANLLADGTNVKRSIADAGYVLCLLTTAVLVGYVLASLRSQDRTRRTFRWLGVMRAPESSVFTRTLGPLKGAAVTVQLKDKRKVSGSAMMWPSAGDDGVGELYLTHPAWWSSKTGEFVEAGAGLILRLDEVQSITLGRDPLSPNG